jgi:hypothetical protein
MQTQPDRLFTHRRVIAWSDTAAVACAARDPVFAPEAIDA